MVKLVPLRPLHAHGGSGELWVNPEHVVTVQPIRSSTGGAVVLDVEVKMVGMNLVRLRLGTHPNDDAADAAWGHFLISIGVHDATRSP